MSMGLTRLQGRCLAFIQLYASKNDGVCPSFDEIAAHLDLSSKSGVHRLLTGLEERGRIRRVFGRARAIELVDADQQTIDRLHGLVVAAAGSGRACSRELVAATLQGEC